MSRMPTVSSMVLYDDLVIISGIMYSLLVLFTNFDCRVGSFLLGFLFCMLIFGI